MDTIRLNCAYKETRLDLDPATKGSVVSIRLPTPGAGALFRSPQKRLQSFDLPIAEDENTFRQINLATSASIYNRIYHTSPRSFLWRVLEDGKVLAIRAVDVSRQNKTEDANLTLRLTFPHAIKPGCIAISDPRDHNVLSVCVLTESRHVYSLTLRPDFFRKVASTADNVGDWCKMYLSPTLSFKQVHRMVALEADQLLLAFYDGALLKLERNSGGDGSVWSERHYNEGGWSHTIRSFTSMIPLTSSATVRHGNQAVELATATSISSPATIMDNAAYSFTVSVDHQLRIWNLVTGKIAYMGDMITQVLLSDLEDHDRKVVDPSQSQLVKVISFNGESALCATYSPLGAGEFKFWDVRPQGDGTLQVSDAYPYSKLVPLAPTSEVWTLTEFSILQDEVDSNELSLWCLWKNNMTYRLLKLEFQRNSPLVKNNVAWRDDWKSMAMETLRESPIPSVFSGDPSDTTDKWLHYILSPGRFTAATLETAIALFGKQSGGVKYEKRRNLSLQERMCSTVTSTVSLDRDSHGGMNYEQFRHTTHEQWAKFCRLLQELDKQRGEALSLIVDPQGEMSWIILADGVIAVRDCSPLEKVWHSNEESELLIARPLIAATAFRESFSDQFLHNCKTTLLEEIFQDASLTVPGRMLAFYDKCDFSSQIGFDDFTRLSQDTQEFQSLTPEVYNVIVDLMNSPNPDRRIKAKQPLSEFGNKLMVKVVQETVELHKNICFDQLMVLILIEGEVNNVEEGIQIETAAFYDQIITILKRLELINWLASTQISLPILPTRKTDTAETTTTLETITVLEGVLRHLFSLDPHPYGSMSSVITEAILQICAPDGDYEAPTSVIQCFLLLHDRPDLAMEFSRFTGSDPFSVYIQGRANLASNDPITAAILFKKAAFGIAHNDPTKRMDHHSGGYLDEIERSSLNAGLPQYYAHIVALYDKAKLYSYVIDFARLALQFTGPKPRQTRTEMHSRLFNAAMQTSRFEIAHSVLALFTDAALQYSSLRSLVLKMCEGGYAGMLVELPFIGLQDAVDEILAQKCMGIVDVSVGVPYHKILYSWRIQRSDFRGAAAVSWERLQILLQSGDGDGEIGGAEGDGLETEVTRGYIALINALSCVDPKQAWILSEEMPRKNSVAGLNGAKKVAPLRKVVTLEEVRRGYQGELDRIAAIANNQFAFVGGDEIDML